MVGMVHSWQQEQEAKGSPLQKQAWMRDRTGSGTETFNLKPCLQLYTFSRKTESPKLPETAPPTINKC